MPIIDLQRRMRELGRIRIGKKNAKNQPERLDTFRLTSTSLPLIESASELYGGTANEWTDSPGAAKQYELVTEQPSIPVAVPPGQSLSQWYEMWSGGGCQRRCDGDRDIISDQPCICAAKGQTAEDRDCKPTTRLNVMLPELWDIGVWRLETHGWYAAVELGGIVPLLEAATSRNVALNARIRIDQRTVKKAGEKYPRHFGVPVIEVAESLGGLLAQAGMLKPADGVRGAVPAPSEAPAIATPPDAPALPPQQQIEAEPAAAVSKEISEAQHLAGRLRRLGLTDDLLSAFVSWYTSGEYAVLSALEPGTFAHVVELTGRIEAGEYTLKMKDGMAWAVPAETAQAVAADPIMAVQEAGGFSPEEFKQAMSAAAGIGQATLIKQARTIAGQLSIDPGTVTSVAALSKTPINLQSAVMDWLKTGH